MKHKENELPEDVVLEEAAEDAEESLHQEGDDVSFEDTNEEGEIDARTTIKKLRERIKELEKEKQEYLTLSQRTRADYINFKKEVEDNKVLDRKFAIKKFIHEILPVLDAYTMAKGNQEAWEKVDKNWRMGIEYIFNQLLSVLEKEGVLPHGKVGEVFNPLHHESLELVEVTDDSAHDTIVRVLQNGYTMHGETIRPARVHVGRKKDPQN